MVQTPIKSISLEEFLALPETKPAGEYFNGQIIQKPMPSGKHSKLQTKFAAVLNDGLEGPQIAEAFTELRCTFGGKSIVPDLSVFVWNRIPEDETGKVEDYFQISPDWTIEILSPDQGEVKVINKILHCLAHGCQMGWMIDPQTCSVVAFPAKHEPIYFDLDAPDEHLPVPEFANQFQLAIGTLFGWLDRSKAKPS
jgi:Uma2 family endonuclease